MKKLFRIECKSFILKENKWKKKLLKLAWFYKSMQEASLLELSIGDIQKTKDKWKRINYKTV